MHSSSRLLLLVLLITGLTFLISDATGQTTYTASITVQGIPATMSTKIYVDGSANTTLSGGQSRSFTFAASLVTHIITVDFYVPSSEGANGTRYYNKETSWVFTAGGSHVFAYTAQYYLSAQTAYSSADGEGWYDSGSLAHVTLKEGEIDEGPGTRHVFNGWSGDASGMALVSNDILMDGPKRVEAFWKTQFYLTVETDPPQVGSPTGSGWYDAGGQANFSASDVVPADQDSRLRFSFWSGGYASQLPTGNVVMDRPKVVKANYLAQYLLVVQYDPASIPSHYNETHAGWYDANENVQLGPAPTTLQVSSVERLRFVQWTESGSPSYDVSITILMDKPHKVILSYKTQYYLDVRSTYGSVSGSGWYDTGSNAKIVAASSSGTWPISYALSDWRIDPPTGKLIKADDSWTLTVDQPYLVEAVWNVDYIPIIGLVGGGGAALALLAAGVALAYRRGVLRRGGPTVRPPRPTPVPTVPAAPIPSGATKICSSCGNSIPVSAVFCQRCGAQQEVSAFGSLEDKVYEYVVKNQGVISLSKASKDLGITVEQLKEITEGLKKKGRLA